MAFINDDDYSVLIRQEIKDILLENDYDAKLKGAESMALSQVRNFLAGHYDVEQIFNKQDEDRNEFVVMIVLDCALYHLYTSTVPRRMPEIRANRYQDALDWLKSVHSGEASADLPKIQNDEGQPFVGIKFSSKHQAEDHRW